MSVLVIDWTTTGAPPPMRTGPTATAAVPWRRIAARATMRASCPLSARMARRASGASDTSRRTARLAENADILAVDPDLEPAGIAGPERQIVAVGQGEPLARLDVRLRT